jgi:hypothetical protein
VRTPRSIPRPCPSSNASSTTAWPSKCWIDAVEPLYRDTGNFTVTLGNTTWNLTGVYFDSPDPTRAGSFGVEGMPE